MPTDPCGACGHPVELRADACPRCAFPRRSSAQAAALADPKPRRRAMWMSVAWPGAGHLYTGDTEKGLILCGATAVLLVLTLTLVGPLLGALAGLALALYAALDCGGALS